MNSTPMTFVRTRLLSGYLSKWVILGALIGVISGLGALVFYYAIDLANSVLIEAATGFQVPDARGEGGPQLVDATRVWAIPLITTLGGLLAGIVVFTLAPEAEGHGTDAAIDAFHEKGGHIHPRTPLVKLIASSITIGSGGSAGREGPAAQISAGFGSWLGQVLGLSAADRRIALAVGIGAGVGAIFKAPFAGAILAAEILYIRDFEVDALIPGFVASVVGYSIFGAVVGWDPVFGTGSGLVFNDPASLIWYAILGLCCGLVGIVYVKAFYGTRKAFHRIHIPPHIKPAIGGLVVGLIAVAFPQVLGMGYGWMQLAVDGNHTDLSVQLMLALIVLKIVATSLSIGSGGSGGVFAPGLFIGAMVGGGLWGVLDGHVSWLPDVPAPFVIVGMMALFGGVAKAPIAVILMVAEMTNEFSMIIPAMLAVVIAYLVTGDTRIYESQVPTRADSPAHRAEFTVPLIDSIPVREAMRSATSFLSPGQTISEAEVVLNTLGVNALAVLDGAALVGIVTSSDLVRGTVEDLVRVEDIMSRELVVTYPDESLHTALQQMANRNISRLPVVARGNKGSLLGMLTIGNLAETLNLEVEHRGRIKSSHSQSPLVREIMKVDVQTVPGSMIAAEFLQTLMATHEEAALVLDENQKVIGTISRSELEQIGSLALDLTVASLVQEQPVAEPEQSAFDAFLQAGAEMTRQMPVVSSRSSLAPVGILRRADVVLALSGQQPAAEPVGVAAEASTRS